MSVPFRVRTITAGAPMAGLDNLGPYESALDDVGRARDRLAGAGYEVQTIRVATPPLVAAASPGERDAMLASLQRLDALARDAGALVSIGPVLSDDRAGLPEWAAELVRSTCALHFSVTVASDAGVHRHAVDAAAGVVAALSGALPEGLANFRFAAAARVPAGTPFFPVAWHAGDASLAIALESSRVVRDACEDARGGEVEDAVRNALDRHLAPVAALGESCAGEQRRTWLGVDPSPAPGIDSSIGEAIESLTGAPFGAAGTLDACAAVTGALKRLATKTCGYAGLMLPVLEDPVLARRASEGRCSVRDLLLFSSVCGTGLDLVPLPGGTPQDVLARVIADVAALSVRLRKPLSARLFPVPGARAGDVVRFSDPLLVESAVMNP